MRRRTQCAEYHELQKGETPVEPCPSNSARLQKTVPLPCLSLGLCHWLSTPEQDAPGTGHGNGNGLHDADGVEPVPPAAGWNPTFGFYT